MNFDEIQEDKSDDKNQLIFHYNRQKRLESAPPLVKDYYEGTFKAFRPGLFKALTATRANRLLLFTLIICFAIVLFNSLFNKKNESSVSGVPLVLSSFSFEENVYVSLCFNAPEKKYSKKSPVPAEITVSYLDADKMTLKTETFAFIYEGKESFLRTTFHDYDIFYVRAEVSFLNDSVSLLSSVEKR